MNKLKNVALLKISALKNSKFLSEILVLSHSDNTV